jgi:type II secretory pathway pseudopilin PulG
MNTLKPISSPAPNLVQDRRRIPAAGQRRRVGEEGYILIAVLFMVAMVLIMLSIAAPKVAADIERDREIELMHRGMQYRRAIKMYYKKFGAYPPNMETLEKANEIRFLRKRYKDPVTGKDEWHLIHFGENKTPTAMGFFGQPLGGVGSSTIAGIGPSGGQSGGGSIFGQSGGSGSLFNNGGSNNSASGNGNSGLSDSNAGNAANGNAGAPTDPNATNSSSGNSGSSAFGSSSSSGNNQTFGGGGIIGVESTSPKPTILEYKKKKHFNEWEFVYDPQADQMMMGGNAGTIGQPMGNGASPGPGGLSQQPPGGFSGGGGINGGPNGGGMNGGLGGSQTPPPPPQNPPQQQQ